MVRGALDSVGTRVVVGDLFSLACAVDLVPVEMRIENYAQVLRAVFHNGVGAARVAVLERLVGIVDRRFVDGFALVVEERAEQVPRRQAGRAGRGTRQTGQFGRAGLAPEVLVFGVVRQRFRAGNVEDALGRMLRGVAEQLSEIRMEGVGIQLHAVPGGVAGLLEELLGLGRVVVAESAPFDRVPLADRREMEGVAGFHAVDRAARGALDLASVGYGQDRGYLVELLEDVR